MARIRTIKPGFFRHETLYEAEQQTKLPMRLAFAGLWTAADRDGRFKWSPRQLKLDCLPFDDVDFSRVLDALLTRGLIVKYAVDGVEYGCIPTWHKHQVINNRESASDLPEPNETNVLTRDSRVPDASPTPLVQDQGEGKGREQEGKGRSMPRVEDATATKPAKENRKKPKTPIADDFKFSEKTRAYGRSLGLNDREIDWQQNRMIRYAKQNDMRYADWQMAAENWLDNALSFAGKTPPAAKSEPVDDGLIEVIDEQQLAAWDAYAKSQGATSFPRNGRGGWRLPSEWPPGYVPPERSNQTPPMPQLRSMN